MDPEGLATMSRLITADIMFSSIWAMFSRAAANAPAPSNTGDFATAAGLVGQISGAIHTAWAFGDSLDPNRNEALTGLVKAKFTELGTALGGSLVGEMIGRSVAQDFGDWIGGASAGGLATVGLNMYNDEPLSAIVRDLMINAGQMGLDFVKGAASLHVAGIAMGAGFYAGVLEYEADSAFNWW